MSNLISQLLLFSRNAECRFRGGAHEGRHAGQEIRSRRLEAESRSGLSTRQRAAAAASARIPGVRFGSPAGPRRGPASETMRTATLTTTTAATASAGRQINPSSGAHCARGRAKAREEMQARRFVGLALRLSGRAILASSLSSSCAPPAEHRGRRLPRS